MFDYLIIGDLGQKYCALFFIGFSTGQSLENIQQCHKLMDLFANIFLFVFFRVNLQFNKILKFQI